MHFEIYSFAGKKKRYGWELINDEGKPIAQCWDVRRSKKMIRRDIKNMCENLHADIPVRDRPDPDRNCIT